ncbi:MAG: HlyD family efflux transporter periplasmic adaptor subunit [Planctomycetota bacterium]|nr:HlyD family efflux transporter periplasmic adaptor subunit [Planctomycetota bacterium]
MASGTVESSSQGSNPDQQQQQQQGISRSKLVQRLLATSANLPAFINDLLTTQAVVVAGTEAAGFLLEKGGGGDGGGFGLKVIAHIRPDQSDSETRQAALNAFTEIIKPCIQQNKDGAIEVGGGTAGDSEPQFCLVTLLRNEGEVVAASAVITRCRDVERAQQRLMSMQLVAGYFDLYTLRRSVDQSRSIAQSHQHVLQLATSVATAQGFNAASMNLCNELATRTGASRVSIGWLKGTRCRVKALSHTEQFDKRQELIVSIERAMEECLDQEEIVHHDGTIGEEGGGGTQNVTREAAALSRAQGGNTVISLPLRRQDEIVGVLTLEFSPGTKLGPQAATGLAVAADLLAPQLYDRFQNDRWLITKTGISIRETAKLAIGPKHMLAKTVIVLLAGITVFLCLYSPMYRVAAKFALLPTERRVISAPYDGQIAEVLFDITKDTTVTAGQPLVRLDTTQLALQLGQARLKAAQADSRREMALDDRSQDGRAKVAEARQAELERDEALEAAKELQWKIDNATIKAPFAGQILQGDLKNKIMAPVKEGDPLIEIGQRDKLRGELKVAERDIQDVKRGQKGMLRTSAQPGDKYPFTVENVVPKANPVEGENKFLIYATLDSVSQQWYPGQEGEARIDVRPEPLIWQWTHRLIEFVRLKLWV